MPAAAGWTEEADASDNPLSTQSLRCAGLVWAVANNRISTTAHSGGRGPDRNTNKGTGEFLICALMTEAGFPWEVGAMPKRAHTGMFGYPRLVCTLGAVGRLIPAPLCTTQATVCVPLRSQGMCDALNWRGMQA